eukprot:6828497-Pyramimonas_sp.AAC.1
MFRPSEQEFTWQLGGAHCAPLGVHPDAWPDLTSTLSQGQTLRKDVTIDCARDEDAGRAGMSDE